MRGWVGIAAAVSVALAAILPGVAGAAGLHGDPLPAEVPSDPPASGQLPPTWCGDTLAVDDLAHETGDLDLPKIKAVAAYPKEVAVDPERGDFIQNQLMLSFDHVAHQSGGRKSLRLDMGTRCGPNFVDILTLRLRDTTDEYLERGCPGTLFTEVKDLLPETDAPRNYIVFLPDLRCPGYAGIANFPSDDQPGPSNRANAGGYIAFTHSANWTVALHEIGHNLGAVQLSAPHADPGGAHCWDGQDIMCYIGLWPAPVSAPALPVCRVQPAAFDCNGDDYFNPSPAPGSYLATHWNVFNSIFLCELASCTPTSTTPLAGEPVPAGFAAATPEPAAVSVTKAARLKLRRRRACPRAQSRASRRVAPKRCRAQRRRR